MTVRAMLLTNPRAVQTKPLSLGKVETPTPKSDEVLVRVIACGVCHTDLHQVEGELAMRRSPAIPGHQVVGVVQSCGNDVTEVEIGQRVGIAWLHRACGDCDYCSQDLENLCQKSLYTGWDVCGGYAEYMVAPARFVYRLPKSLTAVQVAPLLCAGIIGYRSLRLCGIKPEQRLGLYGFGAAAHIAIQIANCWRCSSYVFTRSPTHREHAQKLGAVWTGTAGDAPPESLHSSIIFAPAGELVPEAMRVLAPGGTCALGGIYMSPIPAMNYQQHLYHERRLRSVTNATRRDGRELLSLAAKIPLETTTTVFPLEQANDALLAVKESRLNGSGVLLISEEK